MKKVEILLNEEIISFLEMHDVKHYEDRIEYEIPSKFIKEGDKWFVEHADHIKVEDVINFIENSELPVPIKRFFNEDGSHITKKQYGIILLEILCSELREKFK